MDKSIRARLILDFLDKILDFTNMVGGEIKFVSDGESMSLYSNNVRIFTKNKADDMPEVDLHYYISNLEKFYRLFSYRQQPV